MSAALPLAFKAYAIHVNPVAQTKRDPKFDRADKRPLSIDEIVGLQLKRIRSGVEMLLARSGTRRMHNLHTCARTQK